MGILICEDFWHLSAAAIMQAEEVDLLICVANSPARGVDGPKIRTAETYEQLANAFAQLLGAVVIVVNRVGFEDGLCFWGGSMAVGPDGRTIAQAPMLDEALTVAAFDPAELRRQRLITPLARDERLLLTIEELNRIKRRRYEYLNPAEASLKINPELVTEILCRFIRNEIRRAGFRRAVVGLSGGIDSSVVTFLCRPGAGAGKRPGRDHALQDLQRGHAARQPGGDRAVGRSHGRRADHRPDRRLFRPVPRRLADCAWPTSAPASG